MKTTELSTKAPRPTSLRALVAWYFVLSFKDFPDHLQDQQPEQFKNRIEQLLWWPPDVFAMTASILKSTGSYRFIIGPNGRFGKNLWQRLDWQLRVEAHGEAWRSSVSSLILQPFDATNQNDEFQSVSGQTKQILSNNKLKEELNGRIDDRCERRNLEKIDLSGDDQRGIPSKSHNLINFFIEQITQLEDEDGPLCDQNLLALSVKAERYLRPGSSRTETCAARFFEAILGLHILADAASYSIGVPRSSSRESAVFDALANVLVTLRGSLSTMAKFHGVVLPKVRTPQTGLTLRNLSHNLTFHDCEVEVMWRSFPWSNFDENTLNILYIPYPFDFDPKRFSAETSSYESVGYFTYDPGDWNEVGSVIELIDEIRKTGTQPHMVVFTETAFNENTYQELLTILSQKYGADDPRRMPVVLAGVSSKEGGATYNELRLSTFFAGKWYQLKQQKHHRWQLSESQIRQYGLQGRLSTARPLFESSAVDQRRLTFYAPTPWLVLSPLICEDLSRIEPVSELIRGVGPTLVLALLLDGPQLEGRWPGRYASVLADDPGTGVLTMTSYGIAQVSRPSAAVYQTRSSGENCNPSQDTAVVASWKDSQSSFVTLSTAKNEALLVTLTAHMGEEFTLDNRGIRDKAAGFRLDGARTFKMPASRKMPPAGKPELPGSWSDIREVTAHTYVASAALSLLRPHISQNPNEKTRESNTDRWDFTPDWKTRCEEFHRLIDLMLGQPVLISRKKWQSFIRKELGKEIAKTEKSGRDNKSRYFRRLGIVRRELLKYTLEGSENYKARTEINNKNPNDSGDSYFRHLFAALVFSQTSIDVEVRDGAAEWPTDSLIFGAFVLRVLFDCIAGIDTFSEKEISYDVSSEVYRNRLKIAGLANRGKKIVINCDSLQNHSSGRARDVNDAPRPLYKYAAKHVKEWDRYDQVNYLGQFDISYVGKGKTENQLSVEFDAAEKPNRYDYYRMILELIEAILNDRDSSLWKRCQVIFEGQVSEDEMRRLTILVLMVLPSLIHEQLEFDYIRSRLKNEIVLNHSVMNLLIKKAEKIISAASKKTKTEWPEQ